MKGRPLALVLLGWSLLLTLFRRVLPARPALQQFYSQYGNEGLLPVTPSEHSLLTLSYHCTACGKCDLGEQERISNSKVAYRGLMATVLGGTRSLPDYPAVSLSLSEVPEEALVRADQACPEQVPISKLVSLIRSHAARARGPI
jgi:hypothetical protein